MATRTSTSEGVSPSAPPEGAADAERVERLEERIGRLEARLRRAEAHDDRMPRHRSVLRVIGVVLGVAAAITLAYLAWEGITLVLIALLFALGLNPAVDFLVRRGLRRGLATLLVIALALAIVAALGLLLIPPIVRETANLINQAPRILAEIQAGHGPLGALERRFHIVDDLIGTRAGGGARAVAEPGINVVIGVAGTLAGAVVIAFLTLFMLLEGPTWIDRILGLIPPGSRERCHRVGLGVYKAVGGFVTGNFLAALLMGIASTIVLVATGVPYAAALGLIVGLFDLVPILGPIVALVVIAAVAFTEGFVTGVVAVGAVFLIHQLEVYMLRPLIFRRTVELSALVIIVAIVIGTELAGVIGALAAIPVAAAVQVVILELQQMQREARERAIVAAGEVPDAPDGPRPAP